MKVALVCSHGGHLTELEALAEAFRGMDLFFVTYKAVRTESMPKAYSIENIRANPVRMLISLVLLSLILAKERPTAIVSTGAEIAIPAFLVGKAMGIRLVFVESLCRVSKPSLTGRLVYPLADLFLVQWESLRGAYGEAAEYCGAVS